VTSDTETGDITGTKDKDYIIIWFTEACLSNALRLETHIQDAERAGDTELADFFRRARQKVARCRAEQAASSCPARELTFTYWLAFRPAWSRRQVPRWPVGTR
jgi:hypothetical protein